MSVLSLAICGRNCYISFNNKEQCIICPDIRDTSEQMLRLLEQISIDDFNEVVFSAGPGSFTSMRIIGSIIKGIELCKPSIKILSISTFLSLFSIIPCKYTSGTIAIDTIRGDFYCMDFIDLRLYNRRICRKESIQNAFCDINLLNNTNLASQQIKLLQMKKFLTNQELIHYSSVIDYGINPNYKIK